ncbi:MAG: polysaccharide deacetylase family protein [Acidobacteria bacterium]|nr:polysaccharide deacetylase family protein [Acidobacteriota bacterium]
MLIPSTVRLGRPIVTTSWDDGHASDLRLAELLGRYGFRGTFYVPFRAVREPLLTPAQLREVAKSGIEIGGHTLTHPSMKGLGLERSRQEVRESKQRLEDILGRPVTSFCYPNGDLDAEAREAVRQEGYSLARTTVNLRTSVGGDPLRMPTSLQFYPHSAYKRLRIFGRNRDVPGLLRWATGHGCRAGLDGLIDSLFNHAMRNGGVFHLWGHSWELDRFELWGPLERTLERLSGRAGVRYLTNAETLEAVSKP